MRILKKIKAKMTSLPKALNVQWLRKSFNWLIAMRYKRRQGALGPRISSRAFSRERRYPLVNGWKAGI